MKGFSYRPLLIGLTCFTGRRRRNWTSANLEKEGNERRDGEGQKVGEKKEWKKERNRERERASDLAVDDSSARPLSAGRSSAFRPSFLSSYPAYGRPHRFRDSPTTRAIPLKTR